MSWWSRNISEPFQAAASAVGEAVSHTAVYAGSAVAFVGGAAIDIVDNTVVAGAGYLTGNDWDLYEGSATADAFNFVASGDANELAAFIHENPGRTAHIAMEGAQHGLASATGLVAGVAAGAGGLVIDGYSSVVYGVGLTVGQDWRLYEGSAALNGFSAAYGITTDAALDGMNYVQTFTPLKELNPELFSDEENIIYATAKVGTETVAIIGVTAVTMGTGTAALLTSKTALAIEGTMMAGASILEIDSRLDAAEARADAMVDDLLESGLDDILGNTTTGTPRTGPAFGM